MAIDTLILGLGRIGLEHELKKNSIKTHSKSVFFNKNFKLLCGIDTKKSRRTIYEKKYKSKAFNNLNKLPLYFSPELVIIATPTYLHKKNFQDVVKIKSVKYILIEKPISYNYSDTKYIINICKKKNILLFVNFIRRSNPGLVNLKKILNNKKKNYITIYYNNGFINSGIHYLNLMKYYFGNPINLEIKKIINKTKYDFNIDVDILFKKAKIYFKFKKKIINDMIFEAENFLLKNNKIKGFKSKKHNIIINLKYYQKDVLKEILNYIKGKKSNVCLGKDHLNDMKIIKKIKNEI